MMEIKLSRFLLKEEVVHHINENKIDNRLSNLQLMTNSKHTIMHNKNRVFGEKTKNKMSESAKKRLKDKKSHPSYKEIDKRLIEELVYKLGPSKAAEELNVSRKTIYNKIKELGIKR